MNTTSASPAEPAAPAAARILVWDAPVRVAHWLMVLCFAGAWLTAESERWRLVHVTLGYTLAALVVWRIGWGLWGTRHARFASFVRGPAAVAAYLRGLVAGRPPASVGHNPAGALAIVAMLVLAAGVTATGWATFQDLGGEAFEELHEGLASAMLALVGLHVAAVILSSRLHHENLVASMLSGRKHGPAGQGIARAHTGLAALMLAGVLGFWIWQGTQPADAQTQAVAGATREHRHSHDGHGDDDD